MKKTNSSRLDIIEAAMVKLTNHISEIALDIRWLKRLGLLILSGIFATLLLAIFL